MQIREIRRAKSGRAWEFVRWTYDSEKGRSVPESLGRMAQSWSFVPEPILAKMTPAEKETVAAWWKATVEGRALAEARGRPGVLAYHVSSVMLDLQAGRIDDRTAAAIWAQIDKLSAALRKAKLPRPKVEKVQAGAPAPTPLEAAISGAEMP